MSTLQLQRAFDKKGPRGAAFFGPIFIPFKEKTLHQQLLNGTSPSVMDLRSSVGFPLKDAAPFNVFAKHRIMSDADRAEAMSKKFADWNASTLSEVDKLHLLEKRRVVAVLGVFSTPGNAPVITIGCNPIGTRVDGADLANHGAPIWNQVFDEALVRQYLSGDVSAPTHSVVMSMNPMTRACPLPATRDEVAEHLLPVMLIGNLSKLLFLPDGSCPAVGLFWPTTTTLDEFVDSLSIGNGMAVHDGLLALIAKQRPHFEEWFQNVNDNAIPLQVMAASALPLWEALPSAAHPDGVGLLDEDAAAAFMLQQHTFISSLLLDSGLFAKCGRRKTLRDERYQLAAWIRHAAQCHPDEELGISAPERLPFLTSLFPPEGGWPIPTLDPLLSLDKEIELPDPYAQYEPRSISMKDNDTFVPSRLQLPSAEGTEDFQAFFASPLANAAPKTTAPPQVPLPAPQQGVSPATAGIAPTGVPTVTPSPPNAAQGPLPMQNAFGGLSGLQATNLLHQFAGTPAQQSPYLTGGPQQVHQSPFLTGGHGGSPFPAVSPTTPAAAAAATTTHGFPTADSAAGTVGFAPQMNPWAATLASLGALQTADGSYSPFKMNLPRYAPAHRATIKSETTRTMCPPAYLQAALLLAKPFSDGAWLVFSEGNTEPASSWMQIVDPSSFGKVMLSPHDQGSNKGGTTTDSVNFLHQAIDFRATADNAFRLVRLPERVASRVITAAMQKLIFHVPSWDIERGRQAPTLTSRRWHIFHLLPLLREGYSGEHLPSNGLTLLEAQQFGKFLFLIMAMIGSEEKLNSDYDDSKFSSSIFGTVLTFLCRVPQNLNLQRVWTERQRNCTQQWMDDLIATFELVAKMVAYRSGSSFRTFGMRDAQLIHDQANHFVVVPTKTGDNDFAQVPLSYVTDMKRLYTHCFDKWAPGIVDVHDPKWAATSAHPAYFSRLMHPPQEKQGGLRSDPGREPASKRHKAVGFSTPPEAGAGPIHVVKPLFKLLAPVPPGKTPFEVFMQKLQSKTSPLIMNPNGKTKHPICFRSAFEGSCTCDVTGVCRSRYPPMSAGVGQERMHVDFNDPCWQRDIYREEQWAPVVKFVKHYQGLGLLGPTQWLKDATPNTPWAP